MPRGNGRAALVESQNLERGKTMHKANWSIVPDIRPWNGDTRRSNLPYVICDGMGSGALQFAQYVARELRSRDIACRVELIDA